MFRCNACQSTAFQLLVHPSYQGKVTVSHNAFNEVVIRTPQQEFIADLMFMNQFAVCEDCGEVKNWGYYFESTSTASAEPGPPS